MIVHEPFSAYRARKNYFSPSDFKNAETPADVAWNKTRQKPVTNELNFGKVFHTFLLEPEKVDQELVFMLQKKLLLLRFLFRFFMLK